MSDMAKEEILEGIKGYSYEQEVLLRLIRKSPNGLTDTKFDKLFSDEKETIDSKGDVVRTRKSPRIRVMGYHRKSFILGNLNSFCVWEKYLDLLQLMCRAGLVTADKEDGHVIYRMP